MTAEQRRAFRHMRRLAKPYRLRVRTDGEGFPIIPGRYGQIEWYCDGLDCHSCPVPRQLALAVYSDRPRVFERIWGVPDVRHHQTSDAEMRAMFPTTSLGAVARVIKARRRRHVTPDAARRLGASTAYRATSWV